MKQASNLNFTFQTIMAGEQGETLQHLASRNILWHLGGAIARHPIVNGYGLTKEQIEQGGELATTPDEMGKPKQADLETLVAGFNYLTNRLGELAEFEDYDDRTGAPIFPFAWYNIPTLESYIRNFQLYKQSRVHDARQDQAKALGINAPLAKLENRTELDELVANALEEVASVTHTFSSIPKQAPSLDDLEEAISELKIDPLYIVHQSAVGMLDRAKSALMAGKSGYIDPEILAFARWTCRPQQGMQAPQD